MSYHLSLTIRRLGGSNARIINTACDSSSGDDEEPCVGDEIEVSEENFGAYQQMKVPRIMVSCIYQLIGDEPAVWSVGLRMKVRDVAAASSAAPPPPVAMQEC